MAIRIQREVGGNLAETLRTTAATLREREMLKRQVKTLSAEGRLSAGILIALPVGVLGMSMLTNYAYVSLLWTTFLGAVMSVGGLIAMAFGVFWMSKVVKIEV
jgi:tight adherence protein B